VSGGERIRVLVIDDSAFSRNVITRMLESSPLVEVVGVAGNGEEALRQTFELEPDLITLDLEMPRMDGFTFLRLLMVKRPTPVLVISGRGGEQDVPRALESGAVDFIAKPTPTPGPELARIEQELIRKVHAIRELRIEKVRDRLDAGPLRVEAGALGKGQEPEVVVIGSSTGGPAALMQIFGAFGEAPGCAIVVAQHMPRGFTRGFAERIDRVTALPAREARGGEEVRPGTVLVAPGGQHLELETRDGRLVARVLPASSRDRYAPSADRLFESAAKQVGSKLLAMVLTGMGDDGRIGVRAVHDAGGAVAVEAESTAVIFGMPRQAIQTGAVDAVLPLDDLPGAIRHGVPRRPAQAGPGRGWE
jgi:two-component system chemotaxis response regulator CheB